MKKNIALGFGYSIFGSLGFLCVFNVYCIMHFRGEEAKYPYLYPFCIIVGITSLIACIIIFFLTVKIITKHKNKSKETEQYKKRKINYTIRSIITVVSVALITFVPFLALWSWLIDNIGKIF